MSRRATEWLSIVDRPLWGGSPTGANDGKVAGSSQAFQWAASRYLQKTTLNEAQIVLLISLNLRWANYCVGIANVKRNDNLSWHYI
jgi:hypothetical protein